MHEPLRFGEGFEAGPRPAPMLRSRHFGHGLPNGKKFSSETDDMCTEPMNLMSKKISPSCGERMKSVSCLLLCLRMLRGKTRRIFLSWESAQATPGFPHIRKGAHKYVRLGSGGEIPRRRDLAISG